MAQISHRVSHTSHTQTQHSCTADQNTRESEGSLLSDSGDHLPKHTSPIYGSVAQSLRFYSSLSTSKSRHTFGSSSSDECTIARTTTGTTHQSRCRALSCLLGCMTYVCIMSSCVACSIDVRNYCVNYDGSTCYCACSANNCVSSSKRALSVATTGSLS